MTNLKTWGFQINEEDGQMIEASSREEAIKIIERDWMAEGDEITYLEFIGYNLIGE